MDSEQGAEVLDVAEDPQQEEATMDIVLETTEESREPENPPAAAEVEETAAVAEVEETAAVVEVEETEQLAVNGNATEAASIKATEEPLLVEYAEQENEEITIDERLEKLSVESVPCEIAPVESDESSEIVSGPIPEPENTKQESMPENEREPPPKSPESEPEKLRSDYEVQSSTISLEFEKPFVAQQKYGFQPPFDFQSPRHEEEEEFTREAEVEKEQQAALEPEATKDTTETMMVTEVPPKEVAVIENEAPAGGGDTTYEKEATAEESPAPKEVEPEIEVKSDHEAKPPREDVIPDAESLSFALLDQEQTKKTLQISRILVVLRGLPGSGLSFLARAIADSYKDQCYVICADDHGVKPDNPESSADGYKALDEALVAYCKERGTSSVFIVVDDTNHTRSRLARLGAIAKSQHLVPIFLEPKTQWSRDVAQLKAKTKHTIEESQLKLMKGKLHKTKLPLYFGWFFLPSFEEKLKNTSMAFLKTLDTLVVFKKHVNDFTGNPEKALDLEEFFKHKGLLHCTTMYCNYGKVEGAQEYADKPAVKKNYGSVFDLSLTALFVTPRTCGARVSLTEEQLELWPNNAEKQVESLIPAPASVSFGSRAHVTFGCADGVQSVQTGIDLLQILALKQEGKHSERVNLELGSLTYYNEGRWLLSLKEPICMPACFSSFYGPKESKSTKKDSEKKKKQKCAIL